MCDLFSNGGGMTAIFRGSITATAAGADFWPWFLSSLRVGAG